MKPIRFLLLCAPFASAAHAQTYGLVDLGTLGGADSYAYAVNASGQVVGKAATADGTTHAFLYSGGSMHDLGTFGGTESIARSINDKGQVVGDANLADGHAHAFLTTGGPLQDLGTLGGNYSSAWDINNSGQIIGMSNGTGLNEYRAVAFSGGTVHNLGTLGGNFSYAVGINDAGDVVGNSNTAAEFEDGFYLPAGGTMMDVGVLPGGYASNALKINASGQVAGYGYLASPFARAEAFVYSHGTLTDIGRLGGWDSVALGLNDAGAVVGYSDVGTKGNNHGFIYQGGHMSDLNRMLSSDAAGWTVTRVDDINANGWIVGTATNAAGVSRAVLLRPVPEPATLLGLGLGVALLRRRWR